MNKDEQERKNLNRRLVVRTFFDELKEKKARNIIPELITEIVFFFAAGVLAQLIINRIDIPSKLIWFAYMAIFILLLLVFNAMKACFKRYLRKHK